MSSTFTDAPNLPLPSSYGDPERTGFGANDLFEGISEHLFFTLGRRVDNASHHDFYLALSYAVRDRLTGRQLASQDALRAHERPRAVAYLSAELLIGPQLGKNLLMLGIQAEAATALQRFGIQEIEQILALEEEPGLGNGGLGRLAACFLESLSTLEIPATGYGIRYEFGIFEQVWHDDHGHYRVRWIPSEQAIGIPHDVPVLGYRVNTCNRLRLWKAEAAEAFDFHAFNSGDFYGAVEQKVSSETLPKVLYPNVSWWIQAASSTCR